MSNTIPIGVAYLDQDLIGSDRILASKKLGYTEKYKKTVRQTGPKTNPVTIDAPSGKIITSAAEIGPFETIKFTVSNKFVNTRSAIIINSASDLETATYVWYHTIEADGFFSIYLFHLSEFPSTEFIIFNFTIINGNSDE